jgi:hypothetical protein
MRLLARYQELSGNERRLFFRAILLVVVIRVALWTLPYSMIRSWISRLRKPVRGTRELDRGSIRQVAWAVEASSRRIPAASCLTQAMATQVLLGRLGQASDLRLGVARQPNGRFEAHAWIEIQGRVVNGGAIEGFHRFAPLKRGDELSCELWKPPAQA